VHASPVKQRASPDQVDGTSTFCTGVQARKGKIVLGSFSYPISILPIPNGLEELHHVDAFTFHLNHPRVIEHTPRCCTAVGLLFEAALDKVLEALTPLDALGWLVFQLGDRLAHDVRKQVNQTSSRLHFCAVRGEREAMLRDFQ